MSFELGLYPLLPRSEYVVCPSFESGGGSDVGNKVDQTARERNSTRLACSFGSFVEAGKLSSREMVVDQTFRTINGGSSQGCLGGRLRR